MMSSQSRIVTILVSSPSDVTESEIKEVKNAANDWNQEMGELSGEVHFDVVVGANRTHSELNKRPQAAVNDQVVSKVDCVFAIFADRLGSPTGKSESGTVEEIEFASKNIKNVSIVRSLLPRKPKTKLEEARELLRLLEYLGNRESSALIQSYSDEAELYKLAQRTFGYWARKYMNESIECRQEDVTPSDLCADQKSLEVNPIGSWLQSAHGDKVLKLLQGEVDHYNYPGWLLAEVREINETIDLTLSSINDGDIKNALSKFANDLNNYEYVLSSMLCPRDRNEHYYVICQERTVVRESPNESPFDHSRILRNAESDLHTALNELRGLCNDKFCVSFDEL